MKIETPRVGQYSSPHLREKKYLEVQKRVFILNGDNYEVRPKTSKSAKIIWVSYKRILLYLHLLGLDTKLYASMPNVIPHPESVKLI